MLKFKDDIHAVANPAYKNNALAQVCYIHKQKKADNRGMLEKFYANPQLYVYLKEPGAYSELFSEYLQSLMFV